MSSNRSTNGYIGGIYNNINTGIITSNKVYNYFNKNELDVLPYIRPSNGNGYGATASGTFSNAEVKSIAISAVGSGYTTDPTVVFTGGGGTGASGIAVRLSNTVTAVTLWHTVTGVDIVNGGEGYTGTPSITFGAPGGGGITTSGTAVMSGGQLVGITITNNGSRYTSVPTITIGGAGQTRAAIANARLMCGSGYTSPPDISFTGGGGTGAGAYSIIEGTLSSISVINGGSGYTQSPTVFIDGADPLLTTTSATISGGAVTNISLSSTEIFSSPLDIVIGGWTPLPTVSSTEQKLVGTFAIFDNSSNFVAVQCAGNYIVDWGDGTSSITAANATASKQYTSATYAFLSAQDAYEGYKTLNITIVPSGAANLTTVDLNQRHASLANVANSSNWLDIKIAGSSISTLRISSAGATGSNIKQRMLEKFEFIGNNSVTGAGYAGLFLDCNSLVEIVSLPSTSSLTNFASMFQLCRSLRIIPSLESGGVTNMASMFSACHSLIRIPKLKTSLVTTMNSMFQDCASLTHIPEMDTIRVTNFGNTFNGCTNIKQIPYLDTRNADSVFSIFANCTKLEKVQTEFDFSNCANLDSMFTGCRVLKKAPKFKNTYKATSMASIFNSCHQLEEVPDIDCFSCTSLSFTFGSCYALSRVVLLNTGKVSDFNSCFNACYSLKFINKINTSGATNLAGMFGSCRSLEFHPNLDTRKCLNFNGMYGGCTSLKFAFINCYNPITGTQNTTSFNSMFTNCNSLKELPSIAASGSGTSLYTSMLGACNSLQRIRLLGINQNITLPNPGQMGPEALNELYTNLATVASRTITVTGNWGTASDTPAIATAKGWTVTG